MKQYWCTWWLPSGLLGSGINNFTNRPICAAASILIFFSFTLYYFTEWPLKFTRIWQRQPYSVVFLTKYLNNILLEVGLFATWISNLININSFPTNPIGRKYHFYQEHLCLMRHHHKFHYHCQGDFYYISYTCRIYTVCRYRWPRSTDGSALVRSILVVGSLRFPGSIELVIHNTVAVRLSDNTCIREYKQHSTRTNYFIADLHERSRYELQFLSNNRLKRLILIVQIMVTNY